MHRVNPRQKLL